jgi:hypothetical protein
LKFKQAMYFSKICRCYPACLGKYTSTPTPEKILGKYLLIPGFAAAGLINICLSATASCIYRLGLTFRRK